MCARNLLDWFHKNLHDYNIFISDEDDDDNEEPRDPATIVKQQQYATRLYVALFIGTFYVLFFITLISSQTQVVTISKITPSLFNELYLKYGETLSCPCSTITIPYHTFLSNNISFDPVCKSVFVTNQWIEALYVPYRSAYFVMDFRTTATSQFQLLAALCSLCQDTVNQTLADFNNSRLISVQLIPENKVRSQTMGNAESTYTNTHVQITLPLSFLQITTRLNFLISALNTNVIIMIAPVGSGTFEVFPMSTVYRNGTDSDNDQRQLSCSLLDSKTPAGFYLFPLDKSAYFHNMWPKYRGEELPNASAIVNGFFGACNPLDALLPSTLDCLYNNICLESLTHYFPNLNQTNFTWTDVLPPSNRQNLSVNDRLTTRFVDEWSTNINYSKYFDECAPISCTYIETDQRNFSDAIVLLLSLYGGITILLRLLTVFLMKIFSQFNHRSIISGNINTVHHLTHIQKLGRWAKRLNLFKSAEKRTASDIKQQRITTYAYLILFTISLFTLLIFLSTSVQTITITEENPSLATYKHLQDLYPNTPKCLCLNMANPYKNFTSLSPIFHQVCSSVFVSELWLWLSQNVDIGWVDLIHFWNGLGPGHIQLLSAICQVASKTIGDSIRRFGEQLLITSNVLTKPDFNAQMNTTINELITSLFVHFNLLVNTVHLFTQVNQPFTVLHNAKLSINSTTNVAIGRKSLQFKFDLIGPVGIDSTSTDCICATNSYCQTTQPLFIWQEGLGEYANISKFDVIPKTIIGCFIFDTLLLSTLECYYSYTCLSIRYFFMRPHSLGFDIPVSEFKDDLLTYDPVSSQFPPNTSISEIVNKMMIEKWNSSFSFDQYYEVCAPIYCSYSVKTRKNNFIRVVIQLISTISGLTVVLRLITPKLVGIVFNLIKPKIRRQRQDRPRLFDRMKAAVRKLIVLTHTELVNLNIFPRQNFRNHIDRQTAKYLGRLATRLYILLFIIVFAILALSTAIQPRIVSKTIPNPSLDRYNRLILEHNDTLQCPCSTISSIYKKFIGIEPTFHQICASPFASDQWRINITAKLVPDLSVYSSRDYRRFLSAHLRLLSGLCNLSRQLVYDSINQSLSSFFVTTQLLSSVIFQSRIDSLIKQSQSNAPAMFTPLLVSIQALNHGNAIVSAYGTNFQYTTPWFVNGVYPAITEPIVYDNNCSCALSSNCTTQAKFVLQTDSSTVVILKGLKMGCTPSESFLASTLECFYNSTCIKLIQKSTNDISTENIPVPLVANLSRFAVNMTINNLVRDLFIEQWSPMSNYTAYFEQCAPLSCSYTYVQQLDWLYTMTFLLGLYGGLTLVLKWVCPTIIYLLYKIHGWCKKRRTTVIPIMEMHTTTIQNTQTTMDLTDVHNPIIHSAPLTNTCSTLFKCCIIGFLLLVLMIIALTITTVYLQHPGKPHTGLSSMIFLSTFEDI